MDKGDYGMHTHAPGWSEAHNHVHEGETGHIVTHAHLHIHTKSSNARKACPHCGTTFTPGQEATFYSDKTTKRCRVCHNIWDGKSKKHFTFVPAVN